MKCDQKTVPNVWNKFEATQKITNAPIPGRPATYGSSVQDRVVTTSRAFWTARKIRDELRLACSVSTVKRF